MGGWEDGRTGGREDGRMEGRKDEVWNARHATPVSLKREGRSDRRQRGCTSSRSAERNKPVTVRQILYDSTEMWSSEPGNSEPARRMEVTGTRDAGGGESLFHGCRVSVLQDEKNVGDGWW